MNRDLYDLLGFLEERLDLEHCKLVEELHCRALQFDTMPYLPLTVIPRIEPGSLYPYQEAFAEPPKMMYNELMSSFGSIYSSVLTKDSFPLHIRSNYGIGIISSLFGAESILLENTMPWVEPIGLEGVKSILKTGAHEMSYGLAGRSIETNHFFLETLKEYPKCYQSIRVTQPDMQGPFDIAHLLLGSDLFYLLYDEPHFIEDLLSLITQVYIEYRKTLEPYLTDKAGDGAIYIHGGIYKGEVLLKDDTALINISPSLYERFVLPYNQRIFDVFPGSIHYCGPSKPWHDEMMTRQKAMSVNYGNPELLDLLDVYSHNSRERRPIIGWGYNQGISFLDAVWENQICAGITLACVVLDIEEGKRAVEKYYVKRDSFVNRRRG